MDESLVKNFKMKTASATLDFCADLLQANPSAHTKGALARDATGVGCCEVDSPRATQWCAIGLLQAFGGNPLWRDAYSFVYPLVRDSIADWNNHPDTTPQMVVETFRRAAKVAMEEGK